MSGIRYIPFLAVALSFFSCNKEKAVPEPETYRFQVPEHFPQPVFDTENPMSRAGIELGRRLFYDVRLSANNKVSCASCHDPALAFTDGVAFSKAGVSGTALNRHAPPLFNLAWAGNGLFWDGGATNLESQVFGPLTAHDEMAQNLYELVDELNAVPEYVSGFQKAFGDAVSPQNAAKALAQFQRSLVSAGSKYDRYRLNKTDDRLSADELAGLQLVSRHCQSCHAGELFTDQDYHNNGIDTDFSSTEHEGLYMGRYRISYDPADLGKFKTPSLRNVAFTAPYMHDGRFATLEQVLDHYSNGVKYSGTLDAMLPKNGLDLTARQKQQIISFLKTLSDDGFIKNPVHQKPPA